MNKLTSVEQIVEKCIDYSSNAVPHIEPDDARLILTQDRNQAYTSLVEGIEGLKQDEVCDPTEDCPYCGRNMWCRGHQEEIACNQILTDFLENVVKPLYGKE